MSLLLIDNYDFYNISAQVPLWSYNPILHIMMDELLQPMIM